MAWRPWIVGTNPLEPIGSGTTDGATGRIVDPSTGAGLFNPNTDPQLVGVDPLTGADSPSGVDVGFGATVRRFILTGLSNSDFALGPSVPGQPIVGLATDGAYNPLPFWRAQNAYTIPVAWSTNNVTPSRSLLTFTLAGAGASDEAYFEQIVEVGNAQSVASETVPVLTIESRTAGTVFVRAQYLKADAVTAVGLERETTATAAGVIAVAPTTVPAEAYWMRVRFGVRGAGTGTVTISQCRMQRTLGQLGRQEFTTAGAHTWTKPADATFVRVVLIGGGGGGGGGRRGAAGTARGGGGGGGGGAYAEATFLAADLPATVAVTVGTGGAGGAGAAANDTNGSNGTSGTRTQFGTLLAADFGLRGFGGTTGGGLGGDSGQAPSAGQSGGDGGTTGGTGGYSSTVVGIGRDGLGAAGGGGGGGLNAANTASAGGPGGLPNQVYSVATTAAAAVNGTSAAVAGSAFGSFGGGGGGGGSAGSTGAHRHGANGIRGSGGGGGAGVLNNNAAGNGGNGGDGYCLVLTW
jgi:hypothetical protein